MIKMTNFDIIKVTEHEVSSITPLLQWIQTKRWVRLGLWGAYDGPTEYLKAKLLNAHGEVMQCACRWVEQWPPPYTPFPHHSRWGMQYGGWLVGWYLDEGYSMVVGR